MKETLESIREHIRTLNHSSERMASALDSVEDDVSELSQRVASIEANMKWLINLVLLVLGGVVSLIFRIFA
jgi:chromosome segregation ATPase